MMRWKSGLFFVCGALVGCTPSLSEDCSWSHDAELQFAVDVAEGMMLPGDDVPIGTPPQGGAPYTPVEHRMLLPMHDGEVVRLEAYVYDVETQEQVGSFEHREMPLCSNVGDNFGFWFGGEVHVRFPGFPLEELDNLEVEMEVSLYAADDSLLVSASEVGVLRWILGPGAPNASE